MRDIFDRLLSEIRAAVPSSSHIEVLKLDDVAVVIQLGRSREAIMTITLHDSIRPSFTVTRPILAVAQDGHESVREDTVDGILAQGVAWTARKVFRFGFVPPEGFRRPQSNRGKP